MTGAGDDLAVAAHRPAGPVGGRRGLRRRRRSTTAERSRRCTPRAGTPSATSASGRGRRSGPTPARSPPRCSGAPLDDFPDERWLDVRRLDLLHRPLPARLDTCRAKGFDAVEPDNVDGYANDSGFPLTAADQLRVQPLGGRRGARTRHVGGPEERPRPGQRAGGRLRLRGRRGVRRSTTSATPCAPFVDAGKAVLHVEYDVATSQFCGDRALPGFSSLRKHVDLDASRATCDGG